MSAQAQWRLYRLVFIVSDLTLCCRVSQTAGWRRNVSAIIICCPCCSQLRFF